MTTEDQSPTVSTPVTGVNAGQMLTSLTTTNTPTFTLSTGTVTPATPLTPPAPQPSTPAQPVDVGAIAQQMAAYELRVRELQSLKDRAAEEANRIKQENERLQAEREKVLGGAAEAARQALEKASQLEQQLQQERARTLRAEALSQHPELAHYAELIPATTSVEELNTRIQALTAAREKDLAALQQQQTANTPNTARPLIPPANPARPNPTSAPQPSAQQMERELRDAMEQAILKGDMTIYNSALQKAIQTAGLQGN